MNRYYFTREHDEADSTAETNIIPFDATKESDVKTRDSVISRTEEIKDNIDSLNRKILDLMGEREEQISDLYSTMNLISNSSYFFGHPYHRIIKEFQSYGLNSKLVKDAFSVVRRNFFEDSTSVFQDVVSVGIEYDHMDVVASYHGILIFKFEGFRNPDLKFGIGFSDMQESCPLNYESKRYKYFGYSGQNDVDYIFGENVNLGRIYVHSRIGNNFTAFLMSSIHVEKVRAFINMFLSNPSKIIDEYYRDKVGLRENTKLSWDNLNDENRPIMSNIILQRFGLRN